jgi:hypothetical protein
MAFPKTTKTEDLTTQIDGLISTFSISSGPFVSGSLNVHHNGIRLRPNEEFSENVTFDGFTICFVPRLNDALLVQFEIEDAGAGFPLVIASGRDDC